MSSHRARADASGRPRASRDDYAPSPSQWIRSDSHVPQQLKQSIPQPVVPGLTSQVGPHRRGSNERTDRPPLTHQSQSWAFMSIANDPRSMTLPPVANSRQSPRNVLRRKQSNVARETTSMRTDSRDDSYRTSSSSSDPRSQRSLDVYSPAMSYDRGITESPMEIRVAQKLELPTTTAQTVTIYPELDRYRDLEHPTIFDGTNMNVPYRIATHDLPPPTPMFSEVSTFSGSPSTRFSESPGPGPYSRDTTPTSISSQSPGIVVPARIPAIRTRQMTGDTHTRPPVTRRRAGSISNEGDSLGAGPYGLAAVRESLASSSSNSTVRDEEKRDKAKKKKRLSPVPPSPPPRKSSQKPQQKLQKSRDEQGSPSKTSRAPAQPVMALSPPANAFSPSHVRQGSQPTQLPEATAISRAPPPRRPSRDGTQDLQSQLEQTVPVVHSNLSSTSLSERRNSHIIAPPSLNRSVTASPLQDRQQAPSRLPLSREPTPAPRNTTPSDERGGPKPEAIGASRTPSPSVSKFRSRFPLFSRRTKTGVEGSEADKAKPTRKGPAAGTGHEGYGRLGAVRRRSSSGVKGVNGALCSQESLSSSQSHDPFLADRMAPVIIAGGEIIENRNASSELSRTDSELSVPSSRPGNSRNGSQVSLSSREGTRHTLWPSTLPRNSSQAPSLGSRRPSDSSDSEALAMKTTLAYRRSMQRMKNSDQSVPRLPKPISTRPEVVSPAITSIDESIMSEDSMYVPQQLGPARGRRGADTPEHTAPKKLTKRARSPRKWNLFGRSQSQPASVPKKKAAKEDAAKPVAATVKVVEQKAVAFYTMMDSSEQEDVDVPDIQDVVREAKALHSPPHSLQETKTPATQRPTTGRRPSIPRAQSRERRPSGSHPALRVQSPTTGNVPGNTQQLRQRRSVTSPAAPSPQPTISHSQPTVAEPKLAIRQGTGRPSRLPQVGRIPKVVSARPEQTSPKSFSRPFNRITMHFDPGKQDTQDADSLAKGPSPPKPSTPELTQDESTVTGGTSTSESLFSQQLREYTPEAGRVSKEFLSFSPRQNSLATVTTTCSTCSGQPAYAEATAVVPAANAPLAEDEIWDEYNDLLGEENLLKAPPSVGATVANVFRRRQLTVKLLQPTEAPMESPTIRLEVPTQSLNGVLHDDQDPLSSSVCSAETTDAAKESAESAPYPSSPFSVSEFVDGYGDRNTSDNLEKGTTSAEQNSSAPGGAERRSNASGSSQGSEDTSPLSQVNLRVGSMTVSKWLTFGHVLFSPVRDRLTEIVDGSLKRQSILVIDGLGNDDWSFYAAETYPAATFFNLSPRAPLPTNHRSSTTFPLSPANHHQVQYGNLAGKFPFGHESFTSVVFRFPVAAPEAYYRNIISEARRVLKPGGYIELSILDVDLNNMGNRGRRAVRRLKERIHTQAPDTSLASTSDLMLRLLGRKGFTDIKTCRVGVPVASPASKPPGGEVASGSRAMISGKPSAKAKKDDRSLAEMMSDESPVADENITKMVSKVGRWWYTRCYESATTATAGATPKNSLWNDRAFLAECEEWGTSLKLMVCHARLPDGRARLASI